MSKNDDLVLIYNIFFSLLRSGFWNEAVEEELFPLSAEQWLDLFRISREQTVEGLVYDGVMKLPAELQPPKNILLQWIVALDKIERQNDKMGLCIAEIFDLLTQKNLHPFLVKGHSVSCFYLNPRHRVSGDIDIYFRSKDEMKLANQLLREKKLLVKSMPGFSMEYVWKGVLVEHHANMLDLHNPFLRSYVHKIIKQEEQESSNIVINNQKIPTLSPLLTVLLINLHILKHTLSFGIGLRQLCDSAQIYYAYYDQIDGDKLKQIYQRLGVLRWAHVLHQVLVQYLGLDEKYLPFELKEKIDSFWMINEILEGGNFGFSDTRFGKSANVQQKREHAFRHVFHRFCLNFKFAPGEAFFFPLVQLYSRIVRK